MGDVAIAAQLKTGAAEAVNLLGQTATVIRQGIPVTDPDSPSRVVITPPDPPYLEIEILITTFEDRFVDNETILRGDFEGIVIAGEFIPKTGDIIDLNEERLTDPDAENQYRVVSLSTTKVSGQNVLYSLVLRK